MFALFATSCKPPLPVYFDKPIGAKVQGFDTAMSGDYIPLKDFLDKAEKDFSDTYIVKYDKIVLNDKNISINANGKYINSEDVKKIVGIKEDSLRIKPELIKSCDSIFKTLCKFNELSAAKLASGVDKYDSQKPVAGIIKFTYDRIFSISIDSAGKNYTDTLLSLNSSVLLTSYSEKYFLNFKTEYGWEIMQLDIWENKFLSARPFYFTSYDDCSSNVAELTASTKNIYPNLKPVLNEKKKIIGFKAVLDAKIILEKFKRSEESVLLLKIK